MEQSSRSNSWSTIPARPNMPQKLRVATSSEPTRQRQETNGSETEESSDNEAGPEKHQTPRKHEFRRRETRGNTTRNTKHDETTDKRKHRTPRAKKQSQPFFSFAMAGDRCFSMF